MLSNDAFSRLRRRWFQGETTDLAVWQDALGRVVRFQLLVGPERVIDYEAGKAIVTGKVIAASSIGNLAASPFLRADDGIDRQTLLLAFQEFTREPPVQARPILLFVAETIDRALSAGDEERASRDRLIRDMLGKICRAAR